MSLLSWASQSGPKISDSVFSKESLWLWLRAVHCSMIPKQRETLWVEKSFKKVCSVHLAFGQQIAVRGQCVVISCANIILKIRQLSA